MIELHIRVAIELCIHVAIMSSLDHIISTSCGRKYINDVWVDYCMVTSNHHPFDFSLTFNVQIKCEAYCSGKHSPKTTSMKQDTISQEEIPVYKSNTATSLSHVEMNHDMILCDNPCCNIVSHQNAITRMYKDITCALVEASQQFMTISNGHPNRLIGGMNIAKLLINRLGRIT